MKYVYIIRYWNLGELEEISDLVDCAVVLDESQIIPAIKNLKEEAISSLKRIIELEPIRDKYNNNRDWDAMENSEEMKELYNLYSRWNFTCSADSKEILENNMITEDIFYTEKVPLLVEES